MQGDSWTPGVGAARGRGASRDLVTRLARRIGYAPVSGAVQQIYFREGETVPAQRPVLSIACRPAT